MADEHADPRDERVGRILNEYMDRAQQGNPVDEQELLDANPDLADELRTHFVAIRQISSVVSDGKLGAATITPPLDALPGYEIQGEIHRGGQGVVYRATQQATRRKVAIKVMREGPFGGWRDRIRFEREVRVLGALNHPNIVTIHESGTASGCQFFVMDYIAGSPLDVWLSGRSTPLKQILSLFVTICDAVNEAHIKGIIHRDLKPGNIRIDDDGKPHILDFGLAKVAAHEDEDAKPSGMTVVGQFVGSLPWTSPEQAQGTLDRVDTRTDVYALGVVLYQALTGSFPYEVVGPMRDVLNRIVNDEPTRPSRIRKCIDRDVDAIVLKCLRKEPQRRYQTAGELGRDIQRYLDGEAVAARGDSGWYVFGKTLRRYRVPVAIAAAFAFLVGVSLLASISLWRQAATERDRADAKAAEARQAQAVAEREWNRAERTTYLNRIALVRNAYEQEYLTQAQQLLDACPVDLRGWEWYYLSRLCRRSTLLDVVADENSVLSLAVSPDSSRVVTGGRDGSIRIWDAATGAAISRWTGHGEQVSTVAYSPDGNWIASGSADKTLRLWNAQTGSQRIFEQGKQRINGVSFSADGTYLVAGGQSRTLSLWSVPGGQLIRSTPAQEKEISCVVCSPDGRQVVCGELLNPLAGTCSIKVWDATTGRQMRELTGHPGAVLSLAFSPDGEYLASGGGISPTGRDVDGTLKVFDSASGEELLSLRGHDGFVDAVAFSPDGAFLASAGMPRNPAFGTESDRTLKIWDAVTGTELCAYPAHKQGGRAVAWSPDKSRLFSAGMDGRLKAWPTSIPTEARVLHGHSGPVTRVAFSPDGRSLLSSSAQPESSPSTTDLADNTIRVWDVETGSQRLLLTAHRNAVLGLAWSPDGRQIASGGEDRTIRIWDNQDGLQQSIIEGLGGIVQSLAFSPDGRLLGAAVGETAIVWTMPEGGEYRHLQHGDTLQSIAFSPDNRLIATGSARGEIRIWDHAADREHRPIAAGEGLNGVWFSPDSKIIASAHTDGIIILWNVITGQQSATLRGPQRSVEWLDFSPDGMRIASCTADMMMNVWDVPSESEVFSVRAHDTPVLCVTFSPDGTRIVTSGQDGLIKIWEASPEPPAKTVASSQPGR